MGIADLYPIFSAKYQLPAGLLRAVAKVESSENPWAIRYEPEWRYLLRPELYAQKLRITPETETQMQKCSFGLIQIMGSVARELGYQDLLTHLLDPAMNLSYGAMKLARVIKKYPYINDAIAAYNAGTPSIVQGKYRNQVYVDRVNAAWKSLTIPPVA
jgi:soluble lytic murein transglycosylase-like protein